MAIIDRKGALHGRVSNIVYRTYRGQQIAQIKPARVRQTIDTKEAGLEFGLCSSTAKVFRHAFGYAYKAYDGGMINRLTGKVRKAVSACESKERGERDIHDADLNCLKDFQFNANSPLESALTIRPELQFTGENQIKIYLPAIKQSDIKGIKAGRFVLRLMAISFNFKRDVYSYNSYRDIVIDNRHSWQGGEILMDEDFADGRLVLLSMSVHAYNSDGFGGLDCINSINWDPAAIIGAWHAKGELDEPNAKVGNDNGLVTSTGSYEGNKSLIAIAKLREKAPVKNPREAKSTTPQPPANNAMAFKPPTGDVKF